MRRGLLLAFILALAASAWTLWPNARAAAFAIWNSYGIRAWPTIVLIDKKGIIRYSPIGEGAYEQTQSIIARLLAETD